MLFHNLNVIKLNIDQYKIGQQEYKYVKQYYHDYGIEFEQVFETEYLTFIVKLKLHENSKVYFYGLNIKIYY